MTTRGLPLLLALLGGSLAGCGLPGDGPGVAEETRVEATSFLGEPLERHEIDLAFRVTQEGFLAEARAQVESDPDSIDAHIWLGRRTAYLGRYREAIEIFGRAMERFPEDARIPRHRGHRYITIRELERAIADLEHAQGLVVGTPDQVEPDGLPNDRGIPVSSLHTNILYHLGLARFLRGDLPGAWRAYHEGYEVATNPDMRSAMAYWLVLTAWRAKDDSEAERWLAAIDPDWDLIENGDYHGMLRAFAGDRDPRELLAEAREAGGTRFATVGYGVAAWLHHEGQTEAAKRLCQEIIEAGHWAAFGSIAAERHLAD